jgi:hypothetical protein
MTMIIGTARTLFSPNLRFQGTINQRRFACWSPAPEA